MKKLLIIAAAVAAITVPAGISAGAFPGLPGAFRGAQEAAKDGYGTQVAGSVQVAGRTLRVTAVFADPEQTAVSYQFVGVPGDGPFETIMPRPRLVLEDGTLVAFIANSQSAAQDGAGTLMFAGIPAGSVVATLQIDGAVFRGGPVQRQFSVRVPVDNRAAAADSREMTPLVRLGDGKAAIMIARVTSTPSVIVLRGEFLGLTEEEIQNLGRPDIALTGDDGTEVATAVCVSGCVIWSGWNYTIFQP